MNVFSSLLAWPRYPRAGGEKTRGRGGVAGPEPTHGVPRGNRDPLNRSTFSSLQYADPVTDLLDRCGVFRARLFRESCVFHQGCYVKDLSRLGRDLRKTLILDNSPASYIFHPENAVSTPPRAGRAPAASGESTAGRRPWASPGAQTGRKVEGTVSPAVRCLCSPGLTTWRTLSC